MAESRLPAPSGGEEGHQGQGCRQTWRTEEHSLTDSLNTPGKWCKLPCWPEVTCEAELTRRMGEVGVATRDWSVEVKDVTPLVGEGTSRSRCSKSRLLLWLTCLLSLLLLLLGAAYWAYWKDVVGLRVMALNTWGMPHTLGSQVTQHNPASRSVQTHSLPAAHPSSPCLPLLPAGQGGADGGHRSVALRGRLRRGPSL